MAHSDNDTVSIHSNPNNTRNIVNLINNDSAESNENTNKVYYRNHNKSEHISKNII